MASGDRAFAVQKAKIIKNEVKSAISNPETRLYKQAEEDLDSRFYQAYRIVERLARANKLDNYPWRVIIPKNKDYEMNAHADCSNAVIIERGFIDSFSGEISVLAYVIAHEMAHLINKDAARSGRDNQEYRRKLEELGVTVAESKGKSAQKGFIEQILLEYYYKKANEETEEIKRKVKELEYDLLAKNRNREYAADKDALIYMTKAGFYPKDSTRFLELIKRQDDTVDQEISTHPKPDNRIWQMENLLKTIDVQKLKAEGNKNVASSKPLTYQKFYDVETRSKYKIISAIVVNSKYGSVDNVNKPFEELFGK
ncbi:MAG: hypothetical protein A2255_05080 [Candidatus Melainabacteria bacterium RIFOXYA2_FULL_32_9]|nr:MAG: hypothetical protein A2255_05080 [Candidatus Melainabacteria bacterium RIFOXYA2_FULL_32_9]